jgi:hypothetical protein
MRKQGGEETRCEIGVGHIYDDMVMVNKKKRGGGSASEKKGFEKRERK